jgi:hypothetical protein
MDAPVVFVLGGGAFVAKLREAVAANKNGTRRIVKSREDNILYPQQPQGFFLMSSIFGIFG